MIARGRGCHVWDVDGNEYLEYGMGLRSVTLGHGFPRVADAVRAQLDDGANFVRPSVLELEAAESFVAAPTPEFASLRAYAPQPACWPPTRSAATRSE